MTCVSWAALAFFVTIHETVGQQGIDIKQQKPCLTSSPSNELFYRINETHVNENANLILDMTEDIYGSVPDEIVLDLVENSGEYFVLAGKELVLVRPLDRDADNLHKLQLKLSCAYAENGVLIQREVKVSVLIDDLNDNAPQFVDEPYVVNISRSTPVGQVIFEWIRATDKDSEANSNALITYFISDAHNPNNETTDKPAPPLSEFFEIKEPTKGIVSLKRNLGDNFKNQDELRIPIAAQDNPSTDPQSQHISTTELRVLLNDDNDPQESPPAFHHPSCAATPIFCSGVDYTAEVNAGELQGHKVLEISPVSISAFDPDATRYPVTYLFVNGTPASYDDYFGIDPVSGHAIQFNPLPYNVDKFEVIVAAIKRGGQNLYSLSRLTIVVHKELRNDHDPVLEASAVVGYIDKEAENGALVRTSIEPGSEAVQIVVSDEDLQPGMDPVAYEFFLTGSGAEIFAINQGGFVYLHLEDDTENVDAITEDQYILTIQAVETNTTPIRSSEKISVQIHVIGQQKPVESTVIGQKPSEPNVIEQQQINEPTFPSAVYTVQMQSTEGAAEILKISAEPENGVNLNYTVYVIAAPANQRNLNLNSVIGFGDSQQQDLMGLFFYDNQNATLMARTNLFPGVYQLVLEARDIRGRRATTRIFVDVLENPTEETQTTITTVLPPSIDLSVQSTHKNNPRPETTDHVTQELPLITDGLTENTVSISEAAAPGTVVLTLKAVATNEVALALRYSITSGNEDSAFALHPESGTLATASSLDRETKSSYDLVIEASSKDGLRNETTVKIQILDENDNAPVILNAAPIEFTIEHGLADALVGKIDANDADEGDNGRITFRFLSNNEFFSIDPTTGVIRTRGPLAHDKDPYQLDVVARDSGKPSQQTTMRVRVKVLPEPDRPPVFAEPQIEVTVKENAGAITVAAVKATDPDRVAQITYVLRQGDPTLFTIDSLSGAILTLRNLDAETRKRHLLVVGTKENFESNFPAISTIIVNVEDVNDWIPIFRQKTYEATIREEAAIGSPVLQVSAYDQDAEAPNNHLQYEVTGIGRGPTFFTVNSYTGLITLSRALQDVNESEFVLHIEAKDQGSPSLSSSTTVAISVQREPLTTAQTLLVKLETATPTDQSGSDSLLTQPTTAEQPKFLTNHNSVSLSEETEPGTVIQVLKIQNKQNFARGSFICRLLYASTLQVFNVFVNSQGDCELTTSGRLDRETVDYYKLNVSLAPAFGLDSWDSAELELQVLDINDNEPRFVFPYKNQNFFFGAISADAPPLTTPLLASPIPGKHRLIVEATDPDQGPNANVTYKLLESSPDSQYFKIDSRTGELQTNQRLPSAEMLSSQRTPNSALRHLEFQFAAQDNPLHGKPNMDVATIVVNYLTNQNRLVLVLEGLLPNAAQQYVSDITSSLQRVIEPCSIIGYEQFLDSKDLSRENKPGTEVWFYAINPTTKSICVRSDIISLLTSDDNLQYIRGQLSGKFVVREIRQPTMADGGGILTGGNWNGAQIAIVVLAALIVIGCIMAMFFLCCWWSKFKQSKAALAEKPQLYSVLPSYNTLMIPPSEKEYETQILEMIVPEDASSKEIADTFTLEDGIYRSRHVGDNVFFTKPNHHPRNGGLVIPPPDYPNNYGPEPANGNLTRHPVPVPRDKTTLL